jgi:hypothetical protein
MDYVDIRRVIETYMYGVDAKDLAALRSCFSDDAAAIYHGGTPEEKTVDGGARIAGHVHTSCSRFTASNHSISNFVATADGASGTANTFAIAHVVVGRKGLVRGLRYEDTLVKSAGEWRIVRRLHTPLWQQEIAIVDPQFF